MTKITIFDYYYCKQIKRKVRAIIRLVKGQPFYEGMHCNHYFSGACTLEYNPDLSIKCELEDTARESIKRMRDAEAEVIKQSCLRNQRVKEQHRLGYFP